jgi:O6-methylguanine-DNA--protein-cysteine methyltransferase
VGANPVALALPCHRVLPASGLLGGFAWGADKKRALLRREGVLPPA